MDLNGAIDLLESYNVSTTEIMDTLNMTMVNDTGMLNETLSSVNVTESTQMVNTTDV
jgi:hypothetical protein